jgi:ribosome biogenesis protein UTP30
MSHTPSQILENIKTALPAISKIIKGGRENIQSFHIKTHSSVSLPIWVCNLDGSEGGRWAGLTEIVSESLSDQTSESDEDNAVTFHDASPPTQKKIKKARVKDSAAGPAPVHSPSDHSKNPAAKVPSSPIPVAASENKVLAKKIKTKTSRATIDPDEASFAKTSDSKSRSSHPELSVQDLKAKRSGDAMEKKKAKFAEGNSGKSAKDALIGRKAAKS